MAFSNDSSRRVMSDINVTPMVDVMLVLLVIFMVTVPLIQQGVQVDLPRTKAPTIDSAENKLVLSITKDRKVFLGDTEIPYELLKDKLGANARLRSDGELYLHADRGLDYGFVVDVMAIVQSAGVQKLGMITNPNDTSGEGPGRPR
jgi:biopolymer transport protein TolR